MEPLGLWVILNATVVDVDGVRQVEAVVVEGDTITHVGALPPDLAQAPSVDGTGRYLTPGLIDAHVHLSLTPSGAKLQPSREEELALWQQHLAGYVASGVTTVLDTGVLPEDAVALEALALEGPAPWIRWLGPLVSPDGGYPHSVLPAFPAATSEAVLREQVAAFDPLQPLGIKVTVEDGMLGPIWPLLPEALFRVLREERDQRGSVLYAHAMEPAEYDYALAQGVDGFVHPPHGAGKRLGPELAARGLPVVTTLSAYESMLIGSEPERLDEPLFDVVPVVEREAALDPDWQKESARRVARTLMPHGGPARGVVAQMLRAPGPVRGRLRKLGRILRQLEEAGVTLVLGSDSGNWPVFPYEFHGPTTVREVELLHEAGLRPETVLAASTVNAARMLGIEAEVGRVAPGQRADLLLLAENPLEEPTAYRKRELVVLGGEARSPEDW